MNLLPFGKIYNFAKIQGAAFVVFGLLFSGSILLMCFKTPNFGIDFLGGTVIQARYDGAAPIEAINNALSGSRFDGAAVQEFGSPNEIVIKAAVSSASLGIDVGDEVRALLQGTGDFEIRKIDMVGGRVGGELRRAGLMAVLVSLFGILVYIAFRFEMRFAVAAVLCAINDIVMTIGFILLFDVPVNLDILAAVLTVLGYSLNDTIVVFDRIRETISRTKLTSLGDVINEAVSLTLSRTILTSLTTLFVVVATYMFGGEILKPLSLVLIAGIVIGTLSSIFIAAGLLRPLKVSVTEWKAKEVRKAQAKAEKARMRAMYEKGAI